MSGKRATAHRAASIGAIRCVAFCIGTDRSHGALALMRPLLRPLHVHARQAGSPRMLTTYIHSSRYTSRAAARAA